MSTDVDDLVNPRQIQADEYAWICRYLHEKTGITLNQGKQALVMGRLDKRLRRLRCATYSEYFALLGRPGHEEETTLATDLLTTNETYFFREPKHFELLESLAAGEFSRTRPVRIWSAASSSGEEAYTTAMVLAEHLPHTKWEIIGTDISTRVVEKAQKGLYPLNAIEKIPPKYLKKYCLKGRDEFDGFLLVEPSLRAHVSFEYANLIQTLPDLGMFDVIFLRNVMIYFDMETKKRIVSKLLKNLKPSGYLIISHSETLNGMNVPLQLVKPSVYQFA